MSTSYKDRVWYVIAKVNYLSLFAHICGKIKDVRCISTIVTIDLLIKQNYILADMMGKLVNAIYFSHHTISALFFLHCECWLVRTNEPSRKLHNCTQPEIWLSVQSIISPDILQYN